MLMKKLVDIKQGKFTTLPPFPISSVRTMTTSTDRELQRASTAKFTMKSQRTNKVFAPEISCIFKERSLNISLRRKENDRI